MNIEDFRNKHNNERVFIVGNGPSLAETPLHELNDEYTIATNRINLIYPSTEWRPSYYWTGSAPPLSDEFRNNILETVDLGIPCFISQDNKKNFPDKNNIIYLNRKNDIYASDPELKSVNTAIGHAWSNNIGNCVYSATSAIEVLAQIAAYMGFNELYFIGCDGYKQDKPKKGFYIPNRFPNRVFSSGNDPRRYTNKSKVKFLFDNGTPVRSFINGLSFKLGHNRLWEILPTLFAVPDDKDTNHFVENYIEPNYIKRSASKKNKRLKKVHNMIEMVGEKEGFDTYNATLQKNIDIHTPVNFQEII